jgi:hypothetical protein
LSYREKQFPPADILHKREEYRFGINRMQNDQFIFNCHFQEPFWFGMCRSSD